MNQHPRNRSSTRLLKISFLLKNLLKNSFQNVKNVELMHLKKMPKKLMLKKMLIKFLNDNQLTLTLQKKCKWRRSLMTLEHQVLSPAKKLHIYLTFCGHYAYVSITEPAK